MADELHELLDFAHQIAWQAGKITLRHFQSELIIDRKADESPVTIADLASESFLRAALIARYPNHAILGEEEGLTGSESATYRWILDPIDGTKTFVRGVPLYGVMVGLVREEQPVLGVVNVPAIGEIVYAAKGHGCWWNGRPCRVSQVASLGESLVVATGAQHYERYGKAERFQRILDTCGLFRTWGDCYGHLLVATGRAEVALDPIMNIWDAAALLPILEAAGGTFTDWAGLATIEGDGGISTNGAVLNELLALR